MNINGVKLDFDLTDKSNYEWYACLTTAMAKCINNSKKIPEHKHDKYLFESCILFINYLWGPGTDVKIFGKKAALSDCYKVILQICNEANRQKRDMRGLLIKFPEERTEPSRTVE